MLSDQRIEDRLREFILAEIGYEGPPERLTDQALLLEEGILDSPALFHVIAFLEDAYAIEIAEADLSLENFATIEVIARLTRSKIA